MQNKGGGSVTLFPYALISRHGTPEVLGYYILHEGLIGMMGDQGLQTETYKKIDDKKSESWDATSCMSGSASPTNTGRRRCCPTPTQRSAPAFPRPKAAD